MSTRPSKREVEALGVTDFLIGQYIHTQKTNRYGKIVTAKVREDCDVAPGEIALLVSLRPRKIKGIQAPDFFSTLFLKV